MTRLLLDRGLPVRATPRGRPGGGLAGRGRRSGGRRPTRTGRRLSGRQRLSASLLRLSVSAGYLEATVTMAAVAREVGVDALVNMSQTTVSQMSIQNTTPSRQQRQHWLSEQALAWSGLPVVTIRPTMFLESFPRSPVRPSATEAASNCLRAGQDLSGCRGGCRSGSRCRPRRPSAAPGPAIRTHRSAVAGHARGRPGVLGCAEP